MNITQWKWLGGGLLFLCILFSGYWLSRFGKPYSLIVFNLHKLVALGCFAALLVTIFKGHSLTSLKPIEITAIVVTVICFVTMIVSGGLLSIEKPVSIIVHRFHQILPYITGLASAGVLYLLRVAM